MGQELFLAIKRRRRMVRLKCGLGNTEMNKPDIQYS